MKRLAIIGAGELGCMMANHAISDNQYKVVGFYDDKLTQPKYGDFGLNVIGRSGDVESDYKDGKFDCLIIGVGYAAMNFRVKLFQDFKDKVPFANIIHSSSYLHSSVILGSGVFVMPRCVLDIGVILEDNVSIQVGSIVSHHTRIGAHTFVGPGANFAGLISVGPACFIGIGTVVIDCLNIGAGSVTGGGAVIVKNVPERSLVVGVPGRVIRTLPVTSVSHK